MWIYSLFFSIAFAAPESAKLPVVFTEKVTSKDLYDLKLYPAKAVSQVEARVIAESEGTLGPIQVRLGSQVKAGDKLFSVRNVDPVYQYRPVEILAPVSGVLSEVSVSEGTAVSKGSLLGVISDPSRLSFWIEVPAQDQLELKLGDRAELRFAGTDEAFSVQVYSVGSVIRMGTATMPIELRLGEGVSANLGNLGQIVPGRIGKVSFQTRLRKGYSVPEEALFYKGKDPWVRLLENGRAKHQPVKLGNRQQGQIEVLEGLNEDVLLIKRSSRYVGDGDEVTVQDSS